MICVFVQLRCSPGRTYEVADAIYDREFVSELYSTSGEYDLLMKVYIPEGQDIGHFVNERIRDIPHVDRSLTTLTFKAF
ncbi:MAG TPA: Lrp/AsnC ligand binding domain-containing protein [Amaricoccus sp.]|uniref:Lrp/AsnC family transcriptional regulator n=1 Tax=Amaricoccus sp. TaxID=1872485 RepID=UPI002BF1EE71|nr:Lrp/AsnC ligand binding domain-containing protein [Amaricoccus sp.]HMQ93487.1 Lrp/AsnC ligand binding domain-containing protein [Amaricoccus sp.]HMR52333.1 Lrp/AsnC ligand binding domain-containing protein [Amaricoccus sp.]HMR60488.1 Lrp/AsnC ligand binding domain-containing protein [Amaricoccus sp.]HMT99254.1 Lrp/AsnC ligand binding domain-containing protein [Amaricoccus sp.]